jgi:tRNA1Val (adenine37-N6)-methyltransferase
VEQDRCAMKVCTDACLLGAWAGMENAKRLLDIGTGTGLLSLMMAQRHPHAQIDAVELDEQAAEQARENFRRSPWGERMQVHLGRIQDYTPNTPYELIVCNPPFYPNHLTGPDARRTQAMHSLSLQLEELAEALARLLAEQGLAFILLPPLQADWFLSLAQQRGLWLRERLNMRHRPKSAIQRSYLCLQKEPVAEPRLSELAVRDPDEGYSSAYSALLQAYYVIF